MNKLLIALASSLIALGTMAHADQTNQIIEIEPPRAAPLIELPSQFYVTEHWLSWTRTFNIETDSLLLGTVHRKFLSLRLEYDFYDHVENLQAKAKKRIFSLGAIFDVTDANDAEIGTVEEHIFTFFETFSIMSPVGEHLATAKKNFWGTTYTVTSPLFYDPIATLSRSFFRLKDNWTVDILEKEAFSYGRIDPRLFIVVMAFQTDIDHWRKSDSASVPAAGLQTKGSLGQNCIKKETNEKLANLKSVVGNYRAGLIDTVEPTEEDFRAVEKKTDAYLEAIAACTKTEVECDHCQRILNGCQALLPMLEGEALSAKERSALVVMLQQRLEAAQN